MNIKYVILLIVTISFGFLSSKMVYSSNNKTDITNQEYNAYFLQAGVFVEDKNIDEKLKKLDSYVIEEENQKKYIYVGITTSKENAEKIEDLYKSKQVNIYEKKRLVKNDNFLTNLKQYDILLSKLENEEEVFSVTEAILSSYDEIVLGN